MKDSAVFRGIKTVLQVAAGVLTLLATNEAFRNFVVSHPQVPGVLALVAGLFSVLLNVLDQDVPNL